MARLRAVDSEPSACQLAKAVLARSLARSLAGSLVYAVTCSGRNLAAARRRRRESEISVGGNSDLSESDARARALAPDAGWFALSSPGEPLSRSLGLDIICGRKTSARRR